MVTTAPRGDGYIAVRKDGVPVGYIERVGDRYLLTAATARSLNMAGRPTYTSLAEAVKAIEERT